MSARPKLTGVGVGPGPADLLTLRAVAAFRSADVIFEVVGRNSSFSVSGAVVDSIEGLSSRRERLVFSMSLSPGERRAAVRRNAEIVARELRGGNSCVFATIGDPLTYSTFPYLAAEVAELIEGLEVEVVPGVTSFNAAAAATGATLVEHDETLAVVPAFLPENLREGLLAATDTVVFLKAGKTVGAILAALDATGSEWDVAHVSRLGLEGERIAKGPDEALENAGEYLSLLIARRKRENR